MKQTKIFIILTTLLLAALLLSACDQLQQLAEPTTSVHTISVVEVVPGVSVSIEGVNWPAGSTLAARMDKGGTEAQSGAQVGTTTADATGSFSDTFPIPPELADEPLLVIRIESGSTGKYVWQQFNNQ